MLIQLDTLARRDAPKPIGRANRGSVHRISRTEFDLKWTVSESSSTADLGKVLHHMDTQLNDLLEGEYKTNNVQPHDHVGLQITFEGEQKPYGKKAPRREDPLKKLLEMLERILQSNHTLTLKRWLLTIDIFRNPAGGAFKRSKQPASSHDENTPPNSSLPHRSAKKSRQVSAKQFILQVQEEDSDGRNVTMSDESDSEASDMDLADFIVPDDHMSDDEHQSPPPPHSATSRSSTTSTSSSSAHAMYLHWNRDDQTNRDAPKFKALTSHKPRPSNQMQKSASTSIPPPPPPPPPPPRSSLRCSTVASSSTSSSSSANVSTRVKNHLGKRTRPHSQPHRKRARDVITMHRIPLPPSQRRKTSHQPVRDTGMHIPFPPPPPPPARVKAVPPEQRHAKRQKKHPAPLHQQLRPELAASFSPQPSIPFAQVQSAEIPPPPPPHAPTAVHASSSTSSSSATFSASASSSQSVSKEPPNARARGIHINPFCKDALRKKKCIIWIENPDDELCLYRAVAVAEAHKKWKEAQEAYELTKSTGAPQPPMRVVKALKKDYHTMMRKRTAKRKVKRQENRARELRAAIQGSAPGTFDDVVKLAHHLQRNIVVLNLDFQDATPRNVEFQTRRVHDYGVETTLFVYREVSSSDTYDLFLFSPRGRCCSNRIHRDIHVNWSNLYILVSMARIDTARLIVWSCLYPGDLFVLHHSQADISSFMYALFQSEFVDEYHAWHFSHVTWFVGRSLQHGHLDHRLHGPRLLLPPVHDWLRPPLQAPVPRRWIMLRVPPPPKSAQGSAAGAEDLR